MFRKLILLSFIAMAASTAGAQEKEVHVDDSYGDEFLRYKPYVVKGQKDKPQDPPPAPATPTSKPEQGERKVTVQMLKELYPKLQEKAIDDPTDDNIAAEQYVRRIIFDKAQRYSERSMEVTNSDPILNENNRVPYASAGAQAIRNADMRAQEKAVRELSANGGVIVFVDSNCRFCEMQMPIVLAMGNVYGLQALVVSLDGAKPKGFSGTVVHDNGLFHKLDLKLTPSIVYVNHPKGYSGVADPNIYRIVSQGFYAQDELVKQLAFAGHSGHLLSDATMKDLDVWNIGVASIEDLRTLTLDPDHPETIKQKLQPILEKQYRKDAQ